MGIVLSVLALLTASAACGLSVAVALRVKKLLDPLTEQGLLSNRRGSAPEVGTVIPPSSALVDVTGEEVRLPGAGSGPWVLAFQSVGCTGCKMQMPAYKSFLRASGISRDRVFSIVVGDADGLPYYQDELGQLGHVVHGVDGASGIVESLGVSVFPTYVLVDGDGRVVVSTQSSAALPNDAAPLRQPDLVGG
ncbi:TlpA family protein disulfide reductase [Streptomyces sp. NPDC002156]